MVPASDQDASVTPPIRGLLSTSFLCAGLGVL